MREPSYVSAGFKRDLAREFPYLSLQWSHERGRWATWETDQRGYRWFDKWIESPDGQEREPGEWFITLLRAAKKENQGILSAADRKAWIRDLRPEDDPWLCDDCSIAALDPRVWPDCTFVHIDDRHRRWCTSCLSKAGWTQGERAVAYGLKGLMRKASDRKHSGEKSELADKTKRFTGRGLIIPAGVLGSE